LKIIIPAYQPDNRVLELINEIRGNSDFEIIIIDDGSGEKYRLIFDKAAELGCTVLLQKTNQGKGAALKTAFTHLLDTNDKDSFICADCDGQHTWTDIKKLAQAISFHPDSIILGCRKFVGKVPLKSLFGNKITSAVFSLLTGNKIKDTQTGLRGYSAPMLPWLMQLNGNHYEFEMNQLLEAKKAGYNFHCITIETIYENNNKSSHFHPIRDSIRIYLPILKFSMSSTFCGAIDFILLFLFKYLTGDLFYAVVFARIISSFSNYLLNKHFVFDVKANRRWTSLLQYYLLVMVILVCNYLLISFFNETLGILLFLSKLLTEALLFFFSYTIQHKFIFKSKSR
jgi:glycosyltransferase involved in cell wall biosynthesis